MVQRRVRLAQVVCAVYSLNKPDGATKKEIVTFCKHRFGSTCTAKNIDNLLERGLDEGLLTSFHKRYYVTKLRYGIHWAGGSEYSTNKKVARRGKAKKNIKAKLQKKRKPKRKIKKISKGRLILEGCFKQTSSLYKLWKKEFHRQISNMKNSFSKISARGKSLCKKIKRGPASNQGSVRQKVRKTNSKSGKVEKNQKLLFLKRKEKAKKSRPSEKRREEKKKRSHKSEVSSTNDTDDADHSDRYRSLLKQTKYAVVHGKSWDRLNFTRQKMMRENKVLVKHSQLVQKILTKKHAASWDDLNSKLKEMKEKAAACSAQEERAQGDGASAS